jgi:hypothetical protein
VSYPPDTGWELRGRAIETLYHDHGFSSTATSRCSNATIKELIDKYHPGGWNAWLSVTNVTHKRILSC